MVMRVGAVFVGLSLLATPAVSFAQTAQSAVKLDKNDPQAIRCRRLEETGSLVRKQRVCKTNAEWRALSEQGNRDADDIISRNRAGMNPNG